AVGAFLAAGTLLERLLGISDARGRFPFHRVLLGQIALVAVFDARSLASHALGLPGLGRAELWALVAAALAPRLHPPSPPHPPPMAARAPRGGEALDAPRRGLDRDARPALDGVVALDGLVPRRAQRGARDAVVRPGCPRLHGEARRRAGPDPVRPPAVQRRSARLSLRLLGLERALAPALGAHSGAGREPPGRDPGLARGGARPRVRARLARPPVAGRGAPRARGLPLRLRLPR